MGLSGRNLIPLNILDDFIGLGKLPQEVGVRATMEHCPVEPIARLGTLAVACVRYRRISPISAKYEENRCFGEGIRRKWPKKGEITASGTVFPGFSGVFGVSRLAISAKLTLIIRSSLTNRQTITSVNSHGG